MRIISLHAFELVVHIFMSFAMDLNEKCSYVACKGNTSHKHEQQQQHRKTGRLERIACMRTDKTNVLRDANIFRQIKFWWFFNKWRRLPGPVRAFLVLHKEKISFAGKFCCANKYDGVPFNRITNWCTRTTVSYTHQNIRGNGNASH